ncbi:glutathione S-transferase [Sphingomonas sp. Root710]|uniref:glutathione S-transferase family protein n=1 Tax=Sphingomonas sp. Root710 TaxID=1736594 RepID=UPI0006F2DA9A|nr:glutathione S-transferase N-terminal domain-containing protein [Sphingomonas sp. Root710]KRB81536.1 glutathione S-transferase [Sphingomonas sp. Root710]
MIDFYYNFGPNPMKVALFLEEAGLPYRLVPVDMLRGEQFSPEIVELNPNSKLPIVVDDGVAIFDSNAILLYLAEKYQRFLPAAEHRAQLLSWLMFVATGLGPYSGQAVHFRHYAPEPKDYAVQRYAFEARRHYDVLEGHLANRQWMVGDAFSIVDMATWGWIRNMDYVLGPDARAELPNVVRLLAAIDARPAAQAAAGLREKHAFKAEFDKEARQAMFRHVEPAKQPAAQ